MDSSEPSEPTLGQQVKINTAFESFRHNAAVGMLVLAPVLIAIPPRKLDLYTLSLVGAFVASANQLNVERTGRGLISQFGYSNMQRRSLDPILQEQPSHRLLEEKTAVPDEVMKRHTGKIGSIEEKAKEIWMGGETEGWKEKRLREEQEKLNQGEGYGGMIMDQIWEVWNWGEKKGEELKEKDEQVIQQRQKEKEDRKVDAGKSLS